jgi:hypothetical protein
MKRSALFSGVFLFSFSIVALLPPGALAQEKIPAYRFRQPFSRAGTHQGRIRATAGRDHSLQLFP